MNRPRTDHPIGRQKRPWAPRVLLGLLVFAGVLLFVVANAHLVHVAITSQPDCVPHLEAAGATPGSYRAARSAC